VGPFYFDPRLVRPDITEGRPGMPLELRMRVLDGTTCKPLPGARVDIWHADARGIYSGYDGQGDDGRTSAVGETYLRGAQTTGADGVVTFRTVYPGWYPGRTPHIHIKVFLDKRTVLAGQAYFPDGLSARIYRERAPYNVRPVADTVNAGDFLFRSGGKEDGGAVLAITEATDIVTASLDITIGRAPPAGIRGWLPVE
jgi:protocatechuate 3,4-dioxygenase beta subunit